MILLPNDALEFQAKKSLNIYDVAEKKGKNLEIPSGTFYLNNFIVPQGTIISGKGKNTTLIPKNNHGKFITLSSDSSIKNLRIIGNNKKIIAISSSYSNNIKIDRLTVENFDGIAFETDHVNNVILSNSEFKQIKRATNFIFSNHLMIYKNSATICKEHGFQFWGNWKWKVQISQDIKFVKNKLFNCGYGGIWGAGAKNVYISENVVSGSKDVGIDLEWVDSAIINSNNVSNNYNAGISLFFSSRNVKIINNTITNNWPIPKKTHKSLDTWWVRSGIWLTGVNRAVYNNDTGHFNIYIKNNFINCNPGERRAMWIDPSSKRVKLENNFISGCKIWKGGGNEALKTIEDNIIVN